MVKSFRCGEINVLGHDKVKSNNSPVLDVRNIGKTYGGVCAVNNVSFQVNKGEILGIIGPNGAGKTTTFNVIAGAEKANSGEVFLEGVNVTGRSTEERFIANKFFYI